MELKTYRENNKGIILSANPPQQPQGGIPVELNGNLVPVLSHGRHSAWRQLTLGAIMFKLVFALFVILMSMILFNGAPEAPSPTEPTQTQTPGNLTAQVNATACQDKQDTPNVYSAIYLSVAKKVYGWTLVFAVVQVLVYAAIIYGVLKEILGLLYFWIVVLSIEIAGHVGGLIVSLIFNELSPTPKHAKLGDYPMGFFFLSLGLLVLNLLSIVWAKSFCKELIYKQFVPLQSKEFYENKEVYLS